MKETILSTEQAIEYIKNRLSSEKDDLYMSPSMESIFDKGFYRGISTISLTLFLVFSGEVRISSKIEEIALATGYDLHKVIQYLFSFAESIHNATHALQNKSVPCSAIEMIKKLGSTNDEMLAKAESLLRALSPEAVKGKIPLDKMN